jgi:hypothetical protein
MKTAMAFVVALSASAAMSGATANAQADAKKYEKGALVMLQGCVSAGEKKDTWVLTNVREWPPATSDMGKYGKRYYWLDKLGKDLRQHGGHTIQLTGKISDVEKSELEIKKGEDPMGMTVEIEGPGKDVVTSPANAGLSTPPAGHEGKEMPITLLKVKVDQIKMVAANCQ